MPIKKITLAIVDTAGYHLPLCIFLALFLSVVFGPR